MMVQTLCGRPWWQAAQRLCTFHSTCPVGCFSDTDLGKLGTELLTRASASPPAARVAALLTAARRQHRGRFLLLLSAVALVWLPGRFHLCHQEGCLLGRRRAGPRHGHCGFPGRGGRTCAWGASGKVGWAERRALGYETQAMWVLAGRAPEGTTCTVKRHKWAIVCHVSGVRRFFWTEGLFQNSFLPSVKQWCRTDVHSEAADQGEDHPRPSPEQARPLGPIPQPALPTRLLPPGQPEDEERPSGLVSPPPLPCPSPARLGRERRWPMAGM